MKNINSSIEVKASEDNIPNEIHLLPKGESDIRGYGKYNITDQALDKAVQRFEAGERGATLPIDEDHNQKKATGWITGLTKKASGLWGKVNWTPIGEKNLKDKIYKYFSSEFDIETDKDGKTVNNILMKGGGQTNRPAFHQNVLTPVMASENTKIDTLANNILLCKQDIIKSNNNMLKENIKADEKDEKVEDTTPKDEVKEETSKEEVKKEEAPKEDPKKVEEDKKAKEKEEAKKEKEEAEKAETKKEEIKASESVSILSKEVQELKATIKASEVEKVSASFIGTEKGKISDKAKDSVTFLCNEFHGNDDAMKHLQNLLDNQVVGDVKGEIGSASIKASEKKEDTFNKDAEALSEKEGITYGQALKRV